MSAAAIIVAAGSGRRFGSNTPKQLLQLGPYPVWRWSYEAFLKHPDISKIVVVAPEHELHSFPDVEVVVGGETRTRSVLNGLKALSDDDLLPVLIHDAARPGLTQTTINLLLDALETSSAAAPALPVSDALKRQGRDQGLKTVDRKNLYRVQTPQAFRLGEIRQALSNTKEDFVDDLAAIEQMGGKISLVEGSNRLDKITHPNDLKRIQNMLLQSETRIGSGFDVHAFEPGDHVTLCGVDIAHSKSLKGHSDADAAWHALTDAILGALALGDIGDHFPPSEAKWKDAPSSIFLRHAAKLASDNGCAISNVDITIICEEPKIKPHRQAMRISTANCLNISIDRVSIKATTTEGLGFAGRGEGLAAQATVSLVRNLETLG